MMPKPKLLKNFLEKVPSNTVKSLCYVELEEQGIVFTLMHCPDQVLCVEEIVLNASFYKSTLRSRD